MHRAQRKNVRHFLHHGFVHLILGAFFFCSRQQRWLSRQQSSNLSNMQSTCLTCIESIFCLLLPCAFTSIHIYNRTIVHFHATTDSLWWCRVGKARRSNIKSIEKFFGTTGIFLLLFRHIVYDSFTTLPSTYSIYWIFVVGCCFCCC